MGSASEHSPTKTRVGLVLVVTILAFLGVFLSTSSSFKESPEVVNLQDGPVSKLQGDVPLKLSAQLSKARPTPALTRRDWSYNPSMGDELKEALDLTLNPSNRAPTDPDSSLFRTQQTDELKEVSVDDMSEHDIREREFTKIFKRNIWGSRESRSGGGSELGYTSNIRRFMGLVFKLYNITSLLDSPCGDCNWQPSIPGFNTTQYTGVDIVKDVIEANKNKYKGRTNMRFFQVDLATDPLPQGDYDAILCRDMIQHLPTQAGLEAYQALEKAGAKYLLTSFHSETDKNTDIAAGGFKYVDPMLPPFNFSQPLMYALDGEDNWIRTRSGRTNYKMIGLWKLPVLGQGTGQSITPISTAAVSRKIIVNDKAALELLKKEGFSNLECHRPEKCAA